VSSSHEVACNASEASFFYEPLCVWSRLLCLAPLCLQNYSSTSVWGLMIDFWNRCDSLRAYRSLKGNLSVCCDDTPFPSHMQLDQAGERPAVARLIHVPNNFLV
jgi:hypothetical protein